MTTSSSGRDLEQGPIEGYGGELQLFVGEPSVASTAAQFRSLGPLLDGVELTLAGDGLRLLDVEKLRLFVPHGERQWELPVEQADGERLRFRHQGVFLRPVAPVAGAEQPVSEERLLEENRASLAISIVGRGRASGTGTLRVKLAALDGQVSCETDATVAVEAAPREPRLPSRCSMPKPGSASCSQWLAICEAHDNPDYAILWLAFSGDVSQRQRLIEADGAAWITRLARVVSALSGKDLTVTLGQGVREHRLAAAFSVESDLHDPEFAEALMGLQLDGRLTLSAGSVEAGRGHLSIEHRVLSQQDTNGCALEFAFCLPQPELDESCALVAEVLDGVVCDATTIPWCQGALAGAIGAHWELGDPTPYELLLDFGKTPEGIRGVSRAPAWRTLLLGQKPKRDGGAAHEAGADSALAPSDERTRLRRVEAGVLVGSAAPDPFCMEDDDWWALERLWVSLTG